MNIINKTYLSIMNIIHAGRGPADDTTRKSSITLCIYIYRYIHTYMYVYMCI